MVTYQNKKSIRLRSIVRFLNKELEIKKFQKQDHSKNGLQVRSNDEIIKIGLAVDADISTFKKAKKENINLLIVHHGILWKKTLDKNNLRKRRIQFLKKNKISLYAVHLPLDANKKYGNNIQLANLLKLENLKRFVNLDNFTLSFRGELKNKKTLKSIAIFLNKKLKTQCQIYKFNNKRIKNIAILTGRNSSLLNEKNIEKNDCIITGEVVHGAYNDARDLKINLINAGHYATEILGVKAIGKLLEKKYDVKTKFIENSTGL